MIGDETCNVCGEERAAKIHTDATLHPDDARDGLALHAYSPSVSVAVKRRHWDMSCWQDLGDIRMSGEVGNAEGNLISHVWPGGYPVVYVDPEDKSECLCADTVREMIETGEWPEGRSVDSYTHYEGPAIECTCGKMIESAYGDPDVDSTDFDASWLGLI